MGATTAVKRVNMFDARSPYADVLQTLTCFLSKDNHVFTQVHLDLTAAAQTSSTEGCIADNLKCHTCPG